jgi:hypothetical protein
MLLKQNADLEFHRPHRPRKVTDSIPSPLGAPQGCFAKGQTDTPIKHLNQGEVSRRSFVPIRRRTVRL